MNYNLQFSSVPYFKYCLAHNSVHRVRRPLPLYTVIARFKENMAAKQLKITIL